jgi:predicted Zn-dependent protease
MGSTSNGFAAQVGKNSTDINAQEIADRAIDIVTKSSHPIDVGPGEWEVILEPQAVSEMMVFLNWMGPNARIYHEQGSYLSGKLGQKIFGKNITIIDDPLHPEAFPMPFDFEGYPKRRLEIINKGVFQNLTYDSYTAQCFKARNTGHALPAPNTAGPIPLHIYIEPGNKSREEMIKSVKKGLLVTRLWYVRVLSPRQLSITGMTRDGTFLIENGKIVAGVKNLRFNQSIPDALNNVISIENKLTPIASFEGELGITRLPSLYIKKWNFSSGTLF